MSQTAVQSVPGNRLIDTPLVRQYVVPVAIFLAMALIFGLSYTQTFLYDGNQNTKFLHGLAQAGRGFLHEDWLAQTADPLPVFSFLVYVTASINENLFYVYYILLFGVYAYSVLGIVSLLYNQENSFAKALVFFTVFLTVHSRWLIVRLDRRLDLNIEFLQNGVAEQYLLGQEFQNSTFGVFILLSIYAFLKKKPYWAVVWLSIAGLLHSAYLFSTALIVIAYGLILFWENARPLWQERPLSLNGLAGAARKPFLIGLLALIPVIPILWYNQAILSSTSPELFAKALAIMVHERIPHHSLPSVWLHKTAYLQFGLILVGLALALVRRSRLFPIMLTLLLGGLALTGVQILTGSDELAMLAPWRVSVLLVPISTGLVIAFGVWLAFRWLSFLNNPKALFAIVPVALYILSVCVRGGMDLQKDYGRSFRERRVQAMMDYVKETKQPGEIYLIPPQEPDFDDFRLYTGAPIFINWKSHPYRDVDVLEWYQRNQVSYEFFLADYETQCATLADLAQDYGVTHVVIKRKEAELPCSYVTETYRSDKFAIFAVDQP